jgi:hypothetical protein
MGVTNHHLVIGVKLPVYVGHPRVEFHGHHIHMGR